MKNGKAKGSRWRKTGFPKEQHRGKNGGAFIPFYFYTRMYSDLGNLCPDGGNLFSRILSTISRNPFCRCPTIWTLTSITFLSQSDALIYRLEDLRPYLTEEQSQLAVIRKAHNVLFDTIFYNDNYDFIMLFSTNGDCVKITSQGE